MSYSVLFHLSPSPTKKVGTQIRWIVPGARCKCLGVFFTLNRSFCLSTASTTCVRADSSILERNKLCAHKTTRQICYWCAVSRVDSRDLISCCAGTTFWSKWPFSATAAESLVARRATSILGRGGEKMLRAFLFAVGGEKIETLFSKFAFGEKKIEPPFFSSPEAFFCQALFL